MRPPLPWSAVLLLLVAQAAFLATVGLTVLNLAVAAVGTAAALSRGVIDAPRSVLVVLLLPVLVLPALPSEVGGTMVLGLRLFGQAVSPVLYRGILLVALETTLLSFLRWERERQWWPVSAAMALTMAAGLTYEEWPYAGFVAIQAVVLTFHLRAEGGGRMTLSRLAPLPPVLLVAAGMAVLLGWSERRVNDVMAWLTPPTPLSAQFQAHSRLESMLDMQGSGRVVLRVLTPEPPPHLVGAVYTSYDHDTWSQQSGLRAVPPSGSQEGGGSVFRLAATEGAFRDEYRLSSTAAGSLFVPRSASHLAARIASLKSTLDGALQFEPERGFDGSYEVRREGPEVAPAELTAEQRSHYLQLPESLPPVVRREASLRAPGSSDPAAIAAATEEWLQTRFRYGLGYPFARNRSPLEQFLTERPPAHCEFFATAMTTMLRARGVPARYVTGFLVFERNALGGFYTVRENHAHAWTEAWLPGLGWATFDATPPGAATQQDLGAGARMRQLADVLAYHFQNLLSRVKAGDWRAILRGALGLLQGLGSVLLSNPLAVGALALVLLFTALRRKRAPRRAATAEGGGDDSPLPRLVVEFESLLARRGVERPTALTLLEFGERLEGLTPDEADEARRFLETYCAARYGRDRGAEAALEARLAEVRRAVEAAITSLRTRGG